MGHTYHIHWINVFENSLCFQIPVREIVPSPCTQLPQFWRNYSLWFAYLSGLATCEIDTTWFYVWMVMRTYPTSWYQTVYSAVIFYTGRWRLIESPSYHHIWSHEVPRIASKVNKLVYHIFIWSKKVIWPYFKCYVRRKCHYGCINKDKLNQQLIQGSSQSPKISDVLNTRKSHNDVMTFKAVNQGMCE